MVAPFWHPVKLAGEAAMTDIISGGRLDIGIARGAYSFEYERLSPGLDAWTAGQRMREMIPALKGLWAGDYAMKGEFWSFPSTTSAPKPLQQPHPPLWVAARDPNSHEFAVASGCNVQVTPLWLGDEEVESLMGRFNDACAERMAESNNRIFCMGTLPYWDKDLMNAEMRRIVDLGLKGVVLPDRPERLIAGYLGEDGKVNPFWEEVFDVANSTGLPLNFHINASLDAG